MRDGALLTADCRRAAKGAIFMSAWKRSLGGDNGRRQMASQRPKFFPLQLLIRLPLPVQRTSYPRNCEAVVGIVIDEGNHGGAKFDGLKFAGVFSWPGPIHKGHGQAVPIVDERASPAQREAILRIMSGQDTEPGATFFQVYGSMLEKVHDLIFAKIGLEIDVNARKARFIVPNERAVSRSSIR